MPGRFEGMSDAEWELFKNIFPKKARKGRGMPASHPRKVMNSLPYVLTVGCRLVRSSARSAMGFKKFSASLAEDVKLSQNKAS